MATWKEFREEFYTEENLVDYIRATDSLVFICDLTGRRIDNPFVQRLADEFDACIDYWEEKRKETARQSGISRGEQP